MTQASKGNERMVEVRRVYAYPTGHDAGYPGVAPECLACTMDWTRGRRSIQAFTDLMNRALDKPKEQELEVSVRGELDLVQRLAAARLAARSTCGW